MISVTLLALWMRTLLAKENRRWKKDDEMKVRKQEEERLVNGDSRAELRLPNIL